AQHNTRWRKFGLKVTRDRGQAYQLTTINLNRTFTNAVTHLGALTGFYTTQMTMLREGFTNLRHLKLTTSAADYTSYHGMLQHLTSLTSLRKLVLEIGHLGFLPADDEAHRNDGALVAAALQPLRSVINLSVVFYEPVTINNHRMVSHR